jgi:hypothetical protein
MSNTPLSYKVIAIGQRKGQKRPGQSGLENFGLI